jgi:FCP1-like phosphatase family protein
VKVAFLAHDPMLEVKKSYADKMEKEAVDDLVKEKRGILILDLDHTLFQVTMRPVTQEVPGFETWSFETEMQHTGRLMEGKTYWFNLDSSPNAPPFFLHLRPGMYSFLNSASSLFDLYAYTQGTSEYAKKILGGIDPKGDLFGTPFRLIARELDPETGLAGRKNLGRVFPNEEGLVLIIDDRDDVWDSTASSQNLIKLTPYLFFPDKERDRLFSDSLFKPRSDTLTILPVIRDDQLCFLERLLADLHAEVFFGSSEEGQVGFSFPAVLETRRSRLFEDYVFVKNDRVHMGIFRIVKQLGGSFISQSDISKKSEDRQVVFLGVPGQGGRGSDPELIHPWFVMFCASTLSLPRSVDLFSLSRIEHDQITNMWDCLDGRETEDANEQDLLGDLLG